MNQRKSSLSIYYKKQSYREKEEWGGLSSPASFPKFCNFGAELIPNSPGSRTSSAAFPGGLAGSWIKCGAAGTAAGARMGCRHHRLWLSPQHYGATGSVFCESASSGTKVAHHTRSRAWTQVCASLPPWIHLSNKYTKLGDRNAPKLCPTCRRELNQSPTHPRLGSLPSSPTTQALEG